MIIEILAGSCYNVILTGEPVSFDEFKPYLYLQLVDHTESYIVIWFDDGNMVE